MRITRVHVDNELSVGTEIVLPEAQTHYLKHVLRLKPGAALSLFDGKQPFDFHALLTANGKKLGATIESVTAIETESSLPIELIQGLGRADHGQVSGQQKVPLEVHLAGEDDYDAEHQGLLDDVATDVGSQHRHQLTGQLPAVLASGSLLSTMIAPAGRSGSRT